MSADLVIVNASQVLTIPGPGPRRGPEQSDLGIVTAGAVAIRGDRVLAVGTAAEVQRLAGSGTRVVDARGGVVMPGFVDAHTHAVFAGSRAAEFEARTRGETYLQIMAAGGGIMSTVRATRSATVDELVAQSLPRLQAMLAHGTTTAEVKTGYGLDTATELAMLQAIGRLAGAQPVGLVPTFMGAHAVPAEYAGRVDEYVDLVVDEMLPAVVAGQCGSAPPAFCDVFCEEGAFTVGQSRRVMESAARLGLGLKIHADEFTALGGATLAAELRAVSADHLACTTPDEMTRLAEAGVIAVLLPGTTVGLGGHRFADGREMIARGLAVALGVGPQPRHLLVRIDAADRRTGLPVQRAFAVPGHRGGHAQRGLRRRSRGPAWKPDAGIPRGRAGAECLGLPGPRLSLRRRTRSPWSSRLAGSSWTNCRSRRESESMSKCAAGGSADPEDGEAHRAAPIRGPLLECVPNFSEGRRAAVVEEITAALAGVPGVRVLDTEMDASHNRAVVTVAGPPAAVVEGAFRSVRRAAELIDMTVHRGQHPRIGAADVVPLIPLRGMSMADAVRMARELGRRIGEELGIPVYLYGEAALRLDRRDLPAVRRGEYEGLSQEIATLPERYPDFGPPRMGPAGATAVGARPALVAFNVNLDSRDLQAARAIARAVRESSGGLPAVRAIGVDLPEQGLVQVSMNLTDFQRTSMLTAFGAVLDQASARGMTVAGLGDHRARARRRAAAGPGIVLATGRLFAFAGVGDEARRRLSVAAIRSSCPPEGLERTPQVSTAQCAGD